MSDIISAAVTALSAKITSFDGVAKFVITGEGAVMIDEAGVRAGDEPSDVTMTADTDVFRAILDGSRAALSCPDTTVGRQLQYLRPSARPL